MLISCRLQARYLPHFQQKYAVPSSSFKSCSHTSLQYIALPSAGGLDTRQACYKKQSVTLLQCYNHQQFLLQQCQAGLNTHVAYLCIQVELIHLLLLLLTLCPFVLLQSLQHAPWVSLKQSPCQCQAIDSAQTEDLHLHMITDITLRAP